VNVAQLDKKRMGDVSQSLDPGGWAESALVNFDCQSVVILCKVVTIFSLIVGRICTVTLTAIDS
jgi:hypothetical protein